MLPPLPPEIFDLIVDHLHDDPITLKACCLVSESWVPRARRYLFAHIKFSSHRLFGHAWLSTFPDPSTSPGHHTRSLYFGSRDTEHSTTTVATSAVAHTWVYHFRHVKSLRVINIFWMGGSIPVFVQLRGLSPTTLKSLSLYCISAPLSDITNLICYFPLLEDLSMQSVTIRGDSYGRDTPSTSPILTGSLTLVTLTHSVACGLLDLPNGLRFTQITAVCTAGGPNLVTDLIPRCSDTLESLSVYYPSPPHSPLILSEATRLKDVEFQCFGPNIQWVTTALQTARSAHLQRIMITIAYWPTPVKQVGESALREWQDLDQLLVQLWTLRSIRPNIKWPKEIASDLRELVRSLLPILESTGALNEV